MNADAARVARVRDFNRFYTKLVGALDYASLLDTPYSLTEARVLFELGGREPLEIGELRAGLDLDAGYLSRIIARFESERLVVKQRHPDDARRVVVRLTERGRAEAALLDERSNEQVASMLGKLEDGEQRRLLASMEAMRGSLADGTPAPGYLLREPEPGDLGWVIQRHGALYAHEYGWNSEFEALVARVIADYAADRDPRRERGWIAEIDGAPAGCVFCVRADDETAKLRLLLVEPSARGTGIGSRLVDECVKFARRAGYRRLTLWTNDVLAEARRVYQRAGFVLVEEEKHRSFGHDLVGQYWAREL